MEKNCIVIIGRNYTSLLGMIRAVSVLNYDIAVIKIGPKISKNIKYYIKRILFGKPIESYSKYISSYEYSIEPDREDLYKKIIKFNKEQYNNVILIPTDDYAASTLDIYLDKFPNKFLMQNINNKPGKIIEIMDKNIQKEKARKKNLNVANSWIIKKINKEYEIPKEIEFPIFTKPLISFEGSKRIMKKCNSMEELTKLLSEIPSNLNCSVLAEEFIEIEKEYAILGCSYDGEIIMPGIIQMKKSGNGSHKGVTLEGEVNSFDSESKLYKDLEKYLKSLKFNGLFDIDLYENNGNIYFNELNLRFGASGYSITKSGVNLPEIFIKRMLNKKTKKIKKISKKVFVNEKVNLEDYEAGFISLKEYKDNLQQADFTFVNDKNDNKPFKVFKRRELYLKIKSVILRNEK